MHMLLARSAIERGMQLVAGMLTVVGAQETRRKNQSAQRFQLVSWCSGARSRREDELARTQLTKGD